MENVKKQGVEAAQKTFTLDKLVKLTAE
jgi:hypothetical protein